MIKACACASNHWSFDVCVILVILTDCILYFLPQKDFIEWKDPLFILDFIILMLYTIEMLIKVFGNGFMCNKGAYL